MAEGYSEGGDYALGGEREENFRRKEKGVKWEVHKEETQKAAERDDEGGK